MLEVIVVICRMVGWLGGWLDQVGIRLTQLSTRLKVEAELANKIKDIE